MSRLFTLGSILIHGIVIIVVFVAQLLDVGPLPIPHHALIFEIARLVNIADVQLPAPRAARSTAPAQAVSYTAAPLAPPEGITRESGLEAVETRAAADAAIGVEHGSGAMPSVGVVEGVAAPPAAAPAPQTPVRLRAGIEKPQRIASTTPIYPQIARISRVEGVVVLEAVIDARGGVDSVRVLRSIPLLDQAALDAVRQWRFTPARLNGVAIPVVMTVTVNFSLQDR
jgi:protein TonB